MSKGTAVNYGDSPKSIENHADTWAVGQATHRHMCMQRRNVLGNYVRILLHLAHVATCSLHNLYDLPFEDALRYALQSEWSGKLLAQFACKQLFQVNPTFGALACSNCSKRA